MKAECAEHGLQDFIYAAQCDWWECSLAGMFEPSSCGSVIPQESVTPDGADVLHWGDSWSRKPRGDEGKRWRA